MTPEGRQQIEQLIAEMRTVALVAGQCSVEGFDGVTALMAAAESERLTKWADRLALLLADALPQVTENKEDTDTRVDPMGNSTDTPTASENETTPATVTPGSSEQALWLSAHALHGVVERRDHYYECLECGGTFWPEAVG